MMNVLIWTILSVILCALPDLIVLFVFLRKARGAALQILGELILAKLVYCTTLILVSGHDAAITPSDYFVALAVYAGATACVLNYGVKIQITTAKKILMILLFTGFIWKATDMILKFMFGFAH